MNTIRQQIMSRSLLERVIAEYNLFPDLIQKGVPMETVLEYMRASITLRVEGKDAFTLYFQGPDPYIVMQVTNKIASLFIEGTSQAREQQASDTVVFLQNSRDELKAQLEEQEKKIRAFKQQHIGELPEQLEANLRTIEGLQLQLQTNADQLRAAEDRYTLIAGQLADMRQKSMISGSGGEVVGSDVQLEKLRAELANLQLKYTDEHPDVVKLKSRIAELEDRMAAPTMPANTGSAMTRSLEMNLNGAQLDINRIRAERGSIQGQLARYQQRVESAPQIEQELSILTRDYENSRTAYEDVGKKLTEAERASEMEAKRKGQQFKIIDPAKQPDKPFKPNRPYIVIVGLALGLMIGLGSVFLAEHFDDSFKNPEELEDALGVAVLSAIPKIETQADIERRNKGIQLAIVLGCLFAAVLVVLAVIKYTFA
ncbi:MAG: hypothetical protein M5R36_23440 [Deltaproteobacteria bacterium]|nr:hypothetical protein [Deltaproteobacteria bacterium]